MCNLKHKIIAPQCPQFFVKSYWIFFKTSFISYWIFFFYLNTNKLKASTLLTNGNGEWGLEWKVLLNVKLAFSSRTCGPAASPRSIADAAGASLTQLSSTQRELEKSDTDWFPNPKTVHLCRVESVKPFPNHQEPMASPSQGSVSKVLCFL